MSISGFFGQTMIHGPAAISIGNETDVTWEFLICHRNVTPTLSSFKECQQVRYELVLVRVRKTVRGALVDLEVVLDQLR